MKADFYLLFYKIVERNDIFMIKKFKKITTLFATFIALASLFNVCASAKAYGDDVIVSDDGIVETIEYITYYKLPKEDKKECKADYEKIKEGVKKYDKNAPLDENELNMYIREKIETASKMDFEDTVRTSSLSFPWVLLDSIWLQGPYITDSSLVTAASVAWSGYDNYRSSLELEVTEEKAKTISYSLGFTGDVEIKLKFGFSASYDNSYTSKFTVGTKVPAWTVWYHRPYVKYYKDNYVGVVKNYYINALTGAMAIEETGVSGDNRTLLVDATQYEDYTNIAQDRQARTPNPPSVFP